MQLVVKQADQFVKEYHFARGPVYIGREMESHVCLPHESINYEHAVLCGADETQWFAQDLDRTGRTLLNSQAIRKAPLKDGDVLHVGEFAIEVHLTKDVELPIDRGKDDALKRATRAMKNIVRRYDQSDSPDIRMPAARQKDLQTALTAIQKADNLDLFHKTLQAIAIKQFNMLHTWIGLRKSSAGDLQLRIGRRRTGQSVDLHELVFRDLIEESLSKQEYILIPILPKEQIYERIRSALISPICSITGCHGVIYIDNAAEDNHYSLVDLDYLMILTVQAGIRMKELFARDLETRKETLTDAGKIHV